jgi:hypothetical protein
MSTSSSRAPRRRQSRGEAQAQAVKEAGGVLTHRQILFIIFGLMAGMFLSALDQTIVGTSMRTVADDLDGLALQAWVDSEVARTAQLDLEKPPPQPLASRRSWPMQLKAIASQ